MRLASDAAASARVWAHSMCAACHGGAAAHSEPTASQRRWAWQSPDLQWASLCGKVCSVDVHSRWRHRQHPSTHRRSPCVVPLQPRLPSTTPAAPARTPPSYPRRGRQRGCTRHQGLYGPFTAQTCTCRRPARHHTPGGHPHCCLLGPRHHVRAGTHLDVCPHPLQAWRCPMRSRAADCACADISRV